MKKSFFIGIGFIFISTYCMAQVSIYLRFTNYTDKVLTTNGMLENVTVSKDNTLDPTNSQFIKVSSYSANIEQTLNIGSQSTGAGAGKVTFNPITITKTMDATSPVFFQNAASGTPFKTVEVLFTNGQNIISKQTYKLVAVKTVSWAAGCTDCAGVKETITFEYGGQIMTVNKPTGVLQAGWNRVRNVVDNDPNVIIQ